MEIVNVRIDERLIHGQVAAFWTNKLSVGRIIVVNNDAIKNEVQKMALKMATPVGVKLSIISVETAAKNLLARKYEGQRVMIIVKEPKTLYELLDKGVKLEEINVGNMSTKTGSTQVKKSVSVTKEDVEYFKKISDMGVRVVAQMVPTEDKIEFMKLIQNI